MNKRDFIATIVSVLTAGVLLFGAGSCGYHLSIDNRERNQEKVEQCLSNGYGGAIKLTDGSGWVCVGGGVNDRS